MIAYGLGVGIQPILRKIEESCEHLFQMTQSIFWDSGEAVREHDALRQNLCRLRGFNLSRQMVKVIARRLKPLMRSMDQRLKFAKLLLRRHLRQFRIAAWYGIRLYPDGRIHAYTSPR